MGDINKIDLTYLKEITGDEKEVIAEMLELFISETPQQINLLIQYTDSKNWQALKDEAHKVKPTFLYLGLNNIHQMVEEVESKAKEQEELDTIMPSVKKIEDDFNAVLPAIKSKIDEFTS